MAIVFDKRNHGIAFRDTSRRDSRMPVQHVDISSVTRATWIIQIPLTSSLLRTTGRTRMSAVRSLLRMLRAKTSLGKQFGAGCDLGYGTGVLEVMILHV